MMIRNRRYSFKPVYNNDILIGFDVSDGRNTILSHNDDYFIYMKNVNFKDDGSIEGRYLGEASEILLDEHARESFYKDGKHFIDGSNQPIKTARMVVINNKEDSKVIIVIK